MFIVVYFMGNVCCDSVISKLTQLPSAAIKIPLTKIPFKLLLPKNYVINIVIIIIDNIIIF